MQCSGFAILKDLDEEEEEGGNNDDDEQDDRIRKEPQDRQVREGGMSSVGKRQTTAPVQFRKKP